VRLSARANSPTRRWVLRSSVEEGVWVFEFTPVHASPSQRFPLLGCGSLFCPHLRARGEEEEEEGEPCKQKGWRLITKIGKFWVRCKLPRNQGTAKLLC